MKPSDVFRRTSIGWCYAGGKCSCSFCCGHLKWSPGPKHMPPLWGTRAYPSSSPHLPHAVGWRHKCWRSGCGLRWGGQASQAKPRHFKPSRPLLLEQVLICGDSEMLQRQWTHSPLTHTHTRTNMCLQICFVAVSALTSLIDHFISHSASLEWSSVGFVLIGFSVCVLACFCHSGLFSKAAKEFYKNLSLWN